MRVVWLACRRKWELCLCRQTSKGPACSEDCHQSVVLGPGKGETWLTAIRPQQSMLSPEKDKEKAFRLHWNQFRTCVFLNGWHMPDGYALTADRRPKPVNAERHQSIPPLIDTPRSVHFQPSITALYYRRFPSWTDMTPSRLSAQKRRAQRATCAEICQLCIAPGHTLQGLKLPVTVSRA